MCVYKASRRAGVAADSRLHILSSHYTGREGHMKLGAACSLRFRVAASSLWYCLKRFTAQLRQSRPFGLPGGDSLDPVALLV